MATMPSHNDEGELLVKPSRLCFGGDVVVPERTEKLENEEEGVMENVRGQSIHGAHAWRGQFFDSRARWPSKQPWHGLSKGEGSHLRVALASPILGPRLS